MYKIGTRVKKVRGEQVGLTGVTCNGPDVAGKDLLSHNDMFVLVDQPWTAGNNALRQAGKIGQTHSQYWEPIIPDGSNVPSEASINELLDPKFYEQTESLYAPA